MGVVVPLLFRRDHRPLQVYSDRGEGEGGRGMRGVALQVYSAYHMAATGKMHTVAYDSVFSTAIKRRRPT